MNMFIFVWGFLPVREVALTANLIIRFCFYMSKGGRKTKREDGGALLTLDAC